VPKKNRTCIKPLTLITDRPGRRTEKARQKTALLNHLVTELLRADFNEGQVGHDMGELKELGCADSEIRTWILSCLAYHEALGPNHPDKNWNKCQVKWVQACKNFQIADWAIEHALKVGQEIRLPLKGQTEKVKREAIFNTFFKSGDIIAELSPDHANKK